MRRLVAIVGLPLLVALVLGPAACAHRNKSSAPPSADLFGPSDPPQGRWGQASPSTERLRPAKHSPPSAPGQATLKPMPPPVGARATLNPMPPPVGAQATLRPMPQPPYPRRPGDDSLPAFGVEVHADTLPEPIYRRPPTYPDSAREAHIDGTVMLKALVRIDGTVADVRVVHSVPGLDAAAMDAIWPWRFKPAVLNGRPVAMWLDIPVKFSLH